MSFRLISLYCSAAVQAGSQYLQHLPVAPAQHSEPSAHMCVWPLQVYVYNKNLAKPVAKKCFSHPASLGPHDFPPFISSVCWKPHASLLLAANSEGTIKIFKLTS